MYYVASFDNGRTWSKNLRVTDQSIDRKIGTFAQNFDLSHLPGSLPPMRMLCSAGMTPGTETLPPRRRTSTSPPFSMTFSRPVFPTLSDLLWPVLLVCSWLA